jgi:hypothetical protein
MRERGKTSEALDAKAAHDLVSRAVTALAGDEAARSVAPSVQAILDLAQATAMASGNRRKPTMTSVQVSVGGADDAGGDGHGEDGDDSVTTIFNKRKPVRTGPTKRTPIRVGGGTCITIPLPKGKITICIEWES